MNARIQKTLRFRLAAWNAVVVVLTALTTLVGLRQGVNWALLHEMDQILLEDVAEITLGIQQSPEGDYRRLTENLNRKALGHRQHGWFVRLLDEGGRTLWESADVPAEVREFAADDASPPRTIGRYRVTRRPARAGTQTVGVQVGAALDSLRRDLARIDRLVLLAVGVVLVGAPLVGYWLASRAARTIGQIIRAAARLRPDHLDERLPVRGTGDELDQLARTINGLLDRIAAFLAEKRDFLANAAHELRTPLAAIRSSVEVALNEERSREEYQDLLVEIIDQGTALETLVNQLLLISESEAEQLKRDHQMVALDAIVRRSAEMFAGVADASGIELVVRVDGPAVVSGSRHLLDQLVNNLLDNAIKYTHRPGRVSVELRSDAAGGRAVLTVTDSGIGIPAEDVPRVFDRFFRSDRSRTRMSHTTGTGLGLSICKAVVMAHGGEITCASRLERGTQFTVVLPLVSESAFPPQRRAAADDSRRATTTDGRELPLTANAGASG